jgi:hypothetical protein
LKLPRHRQPGKQMAAGSAAGENYPHTKPYGAIG